MATNTPAATPPCIYCGKPAARVDEGEHIIPKAIGGARTILDYAERYVCGRCNNGILSHLDRELCSRSFLSTLASQELAADIWQAWDVDHSSENLLVEARPFWKDGELARLIPYPQLVFEESGPQIRGDAVEMDAFVVDNFKRVLLTAVLGAFQRHSNGQKRSLHMEHVRTEMIAGRYRLAPRIFTTHTIAEIEKKIDKQSFILRYATAEDRQRALLTLSRLDVNHPFGQYAAKQGSRVPAISLYFDLGRVLRALVKIGFNLLAAFCTNTSVNCESFPIATKMILGIGIHPGQRAIENSGFIHAADIPGISTPNCHSFRIISLLDGWRVYSSFFAGRIGTVVELPGPNNETWGTMDIIAPINGKEWQVKTSPIAQLTAYRIENENVGLIAPSLKLQHSAGKLVVEEVKQGWNDHNSDTPPAPPAAQ